MCARRGADPDAREGGGRGALYVANTDTVFRLERDGKVDDVLTGLPGRGDHQTNYPVVGPDGKLYSTVDRGEIEVAPEAGGVGMQAGSGTLWRIRRTKASVGFAPPPPRTVPLYAFLYYVPALALAVAIVALLAWLLAR